jgi:rhodanese-related sulfurtransferase
MSSKVRCIELDPPECTRFLQENREEGCLVIDVRTPKEFAGGHIDGAINIDYFSPDFKEQIEGLDRGQPCVIYCKQGVRGGKTLEIMRGCGFVRVVNIRGGIDHWRSAGLPTV